jgi:hypothetical protein
VYITANPQVNIHLEDEFFKIINVWEEDWDESLHTVMPGVMAEKTIQAYNSYPHKRLISHFIQPHYPFVGEVARENIMSHSGMELSKRIANNESAQRDYSSIWEKLYEQLVSVNTVWDAYQENLNLVLPHVENLINIFDEYTVVTSDHGNAFGERARPVPNKVYGHPKGIYIPALTDIPWLISNADNRKTVTSGHKSSTDRNQVTKASQRLARLGYK